MSLEGVRAWIGEVERKLRARTRVFLALAVIAIGLGGAALYLAIDTRDDAVSEGDVQALQEKLETRIDEVAAGTAATTPPPVEAEPAPSTPPAEEPSPTPEGGKESGGKNGKGSVETPSAGTSGEAAPTVPKSATGGAANSAEIEKLLEEAKKRDAEAEAKQRSEAGNGK